MGEDEQPITQLLDEAPTRVDSDFDEGTAPTLTGAPDAPVVTKAGLAVPTHLGHFELRDVLGEGGMGAVYRAFDTSLHREVAVKVLRAEVAQSPMLIARFQREARSQAKLTHPNITTIYFVGDQDGFPYFAIELVPGGTLADSLRGGQRLSWPDAVDYMTQVVAGLEHAHERGIIHRDIKPANLLLDGGGRIKIADFGLAKPIEEGDVELTAAGSFMGTPQYVAPEQARGESVDHRADIYSLGATFFHLLAGRPPFEAPTPVGVVMKHGSEPLPDLRTFNAEVPPRVRDLLGRMMAKSPDDRFASYAELADALEAVRPRSTQPAGFLVRSAAMSLDILPWLFLTEINEWLLLGFPLYLLITHAAFGQTLGKALFRLKVVDEHRDRPSFARAGIRAAAFGWILFAILGVAGMNLLLFGHSELHFNVSEDQLQISAGGEQYEGARVAEDGAEPLPVTEVPATNSVGEVVPSAVWVMLAVSVLLVALWLAGLLITALDPKKRALHDRVAKTRVLYATD